MKKCTRWGDALETLTLAQTDDVASPSSTVAGAATPLTYGVTLSDVSGGNESALSFMVGFNDQTTRAVLTFADTPTNMGVSVGMDVTQSGASIGTVAAVDDAAMALTA